MLMPDITKVYVEVVFTAVGFDCLGRVVVRTRSYHRSETVNTINAQSKVF